MTHGALTRRPSALPGGDAALLGAGAEGSVHSWELVTSVDGPGTRFTLFLAGCPLRCLYCHNPDTIRPRRGQRWRVEEVLGRIRRYAPVMRATSGGVTLSGGEPLLQHAFVRRVLRGCRELGVHTALDTSGFLGRLADDSLLDDVDLVLLDVKAGSEERYRQVTSRALQPTLDFGERLSVRGTAAWVRFVLVPGLTDDPENVEAVARIVARWRSVERVEVLPFHQMGRHKWDDLGMNYQLGDVEPPAGEQVEAARRVFREHGLPVF